MSAYSQVHIIKAKIKYEHFFVSILLTTMTISPLFSYNDK